MLYEVITLGAGQRELQVAGEVPRRRGEVAEQFCQGAELLLELLLLGDDQQLIGLEGILELGAGQPGQGHQERTEAVAVEQRQPIRPPPSTEVRQNCPGSHRRATATDQS